MATTMSRTGPIEVIRACRSTTWTLDGFRASWRTLRTRLNSRRKAPLRRKHHAVAQHALARPTVRSRVTNHGARRPHHANRLHAAHAGLVKGERQSRSIIYRANLARFREVALFLLRDCCGGRPDICAPIIADLTPSCPAKAVSHA